MTGYYNPHPPFRPLTTPVQKHFKSLLDCWKESKIYREEYSNGEVKYVIKAADYGGHATFMTLKEARKYREEMIKSFTPVVLVKSEIVNES